MSGALARLHSLLGHDYVVWVRRHGPAPRHPAIGTWSRCRRCGHERDWLFIVPGLSDDTMVLDAQTGDWERLGEALRCARAPGAGAAGVWPGPSTAPARGR